MGGVSTEKSLLKTRSLHPIPPPPSMSPRKRGGGASTLSPQVAESPDVIDSDEYERRKVDFKRDRLMHRNSSAIAKEVLTEYEDDAEREIKTNAAVFASSTAAQREEYERLEAEIKRVQNKNAQLVDTL